MRAHFCLPSIVSDEMERKPPISVKFEIPYFTTSGLQVGFYISTKIGPKPALILAYFLFFNILKELFRFVT